jgi:asparagine synthase (glutamine-hydrolysing)
MCGICGVVSTGPDRAARLRAVGHMSNALVHRGPNDSGQFAEESVALGVRRLSILDLSDHGHMPMSTPDGRFHLVYNGEVYNHQELRTSLESRGISFRSTSDAEVVLWLYATYGLASLDKLNGMFAFAIWDSVERSLCLARDRLGIKPLYYVHSNHRLLFASEQKALFAAGVDCSFDESVWEELLCFGYVAGPNTPYPNVRRLLPGHHLIWRNGNVRVTRWWNLKTAAREHYREPADAIEHYGRLFGESVNLQRIADVPLGVFLSGGLDSSSIAASLARQVGDGVASFTMRFDEAAFDEGPFAEAVAKQYRMDHHPMRIPVDKLWAHLETASHLLDEPLAHCNDLYLHAIASYAKPLVTVLLSGEGADETLGGYVRYRPLRLPGLFQMRQLLRPIVTRAGQLHPRIRKLGRFLQLSSISDYVLYNTSNILPADLKLLGFQPRENFTYRREVLAEAMEYSAEPVRQAMFLDQHTFLCSLLDRNDRMTMGASIECRVPFLDHRLVEFAATVPTNQLFGLIQGKRLLREAFRDHLPQQVIAHRKWGFGVPWAHYLRTFQPLRERLLDLADSEPIRSGPLDRKAIRATVEMFLKGSSEGYFVLLQLMMIAVWYETLQNRQGNRELMAAGQ